MPIPTHDHDTYRLEMRGAGEVQAVQVGFVGGMGWMMGVFLGEGEVM